MSIATLLSPRVAVVGIKRPASCMCSNDSTPNKRFMLSAANHTATKPFPISALVAYPGLPLGLAPPPGLPVPAHLRVSPPTQVNADNAIPPYETPRGVGLGLGIVVPSGTISKAVGLYGESRRLPKGPVARWVYPYAAELRPAPHFKRTSAPSEHAPNPVEPVRANIADVLVRGLVQSFTNWQVPLQSTHQPNQDMQIPLPSPRRDFSLLEPTWITPEEERLFDLGNDEAEITHIECAGARSYPEQNAEETSLVTQGGAHVRNALANFRTRFGELFTSAEGRREYA